MANGLNKKVSLNVDNISKIPSLENALKSGRINIILVFAEWCGACHKFRKNIWDPMLQKNAMHNRIAVRDDVIGKTSLRGANFDYLPSILVVDEKGVAQVFNTPEGKTTNATPTPKNLTDMLKMVNIPVKPLAAAAAPPNSTAIAVPAAAPLNMSNVAVRKNADPTALMEEISANIRRNNALNTTMNQAPTMNLNTTNIQRNNALNTTMNKASNMDLNMEINNSLNTTMNKPLNTFLNESPLNISTNSKKQSAIPEGTVFTPTPLVAPQRGGSLLAALQSTVQGVIPATVLGSLVLALRGGGKRRKTKRVLARSKIDRRTRRHK